MPSPASAAARRQRAGSQLELRVVGKRPAAEGEPARLPDGADVSCVESWPVRVHGAHPDPDRVRPGPQLVDEPPALLAGDPALARDRQPAVERHRRLVGDERAALGDPRPPSLVLGPRLEEVCVHDLYPAAPGVSSPPPASGFGSSEAATTRLTPAAKHGLGAGRRRSVVRARLHGQVERRARSPLSRCLEREHLGVRLASSSVPALADDLAVADDDRPDHGVRMRRSASLLRELECPREVLVHAASSTSSS